MIRIADKLDKPQNLEFSKSSNFREIKPILKTTDNKVHSFWEDVFSEQESPDYTYLTEEEIVSEVFERSESDFEFDFDIADEVVQEQTAKFDVENWDESSDSKKIQIIKGFLNCLCERMGIEEQPKLVLFEDDENVCGAYNHQTNAMELNRNIFNNPIEVLDTVAHETRHAYQYQRACIGETREDVLYAANFLNYIEPIQIDGKYVNFNEYQNQLVEAEARAFAKMFGN